MAFATTPNLLGQVAYPGQAMMAPVSQLGALPLSQPTLNQQMVEMQAKMQLL